METTRYQQQPTRSTTPAPPVSGGRSNTPVYNPGSFDVPVAERSQSTPSDPWIGSSAPAETLGLGTYIRLVRRYRGLIAVVVTLCTSAAVVKMFISPKVFMATTTILPSGTQAGGGMLSLLASMTGAPAMIGGSTENSSALFPRILESRELSLEVLQSKFNYVKAGVTGEGTLIEYLEARNEDEALLGLKAIRSVSVDKEMGIISVSVSTPDPQLAAQVANRCAEVLEKYNRDTRRIDATENSSFIQDRLDKVRVELTDAEERLAQFKMENMRSASAELDLERLRLERDVALKSQVFVTLNNQAEIARVEEAKNMPIVRVLDRAVAPELPVRVPKIPLLAAGGLGGLILAAMLIAGLEFLKSLRFEAARA